MVDRGVVEYASAKPDGDRASAEVFVGAICRPLKRLSILASFCQNRNGTTLSCTSMQSRYRGWPAQSNHALDTVWLPI